MSPFSYCQSYPLGEGFTIQFTLEGSSLQAAWLPEVPSGKQADRLLKPYREARGQFIASLGMRALVVEL